MSIASQPRLSVPREPALARWYATQWGRWLTPSLSDLLLLSLFAVLFLTGAHRFDGLLADADIGWHIRTGEHILDSGSVPSQDLFSFTKPDAPWFAWEWLSDVVFALVHRGWGLGGVVLLASFGITAFALILIRRSLWQGSNIFAAAAVGLFGMGAASIHYLARPHVFTLLLFALSMWMVESDRRKSTRAVWLLVPLTALWTNLHGGFLVLIAALALLTVGTAVEAWLGRSDWRWARRYAGLCGLCAVASLLNPYGIKLHIHIVDYLRSDWIRSAIQEFQPPSYKSENLVQFELLLIGGLIVCGLLIREWRIVETLWVVAFAHLAINSARHIPLFVIVSGPYVAQYLSRLINLWTGAGGKGTIPRILGEVVRDLGPSFRRSSVWGVVLVVGAALSSGVLSRIVDFPDPRFPTVLVSRNAELLTASRVFTDDQWADYLIYRFYPRQRVFIDGRSDFFGPRIGDQYSMVIQGLAGWNEVLRRSGISVVLARSEWPLTSLLRSDNAWRALDEVTQGVLFVKSTGFPGR